jgi:hypothetical protein
MITRKTLIITVLCTFCLTVSIFSIMPVSSIGTYDPWLDYNGDGKIDLKDVYPMHLAYGAAGDSTKNVNVTNWQISGDVSVWFLEEVVPGGLMSPAYDAGGFGHLHVLAVGSYLSGAETLTVNIKARLYNEAKTAYHGVTVYTFTLTSSTNTADISISVPSESFYFTAPYDAASSCQVSLSFYLTWA